MSLFFSLTHVHRHMHRSSFTLVLPDHPLSPRTSALALWSSLLSSPDITIPAELRSGSPTLWPSPLRLSGSPRPQNWGLKAYYRGDTRGLDSEDWGAGCSPGRLPTIGRSLLPPHGAAAATLQSPFPTLIEARKGMGRGGGHGRGKPEGRGSWQTSVRRKDTLGAEKGAFTLQSVPRCPFPQVKHRGPSGGFYFKLLLYFGHLLGCDSKLSKMQDKNSVAGAVERNVREQGVPASPLPL